MTSDIFAEVERDIKRPLSDGERAAIGGLVLADRLPKNLRKRKRCLRRARQEAYRACRAGSEGKEMNRLRRFFEKMPYGRRSSRVAYVISVAALPEALANAEWTEDQSFRAADALLADPGLKAVYQMALEKGCAIVTAPAAKT
jgi:hypothetical protein